MMKCVGGGGRYACDGSKAVIREGSAHDAQGHQPHLQLSSLNQNSSQDRAGAATGMRACLAGPELGQEQNLPAMLS
jgi:hypothetical protein